ncbi:hypothetical protein Tco_1564361 [Tanacetum coccineum]
MQAARDRQNSYADLKRKPMEFEVIKRVRDVAYKLELPEELSRVHNTFHVSNLKKCHADEPLAVPLDGLHFDDKLQFVEEPIEITDREVKRLKQSRIPLVKARGAKDALDYVLDCTVKDICASCFGKSIKGHFAREYRSGRNQGKRSYGDNSGSNAPTNESSSQALVAQDGLSEDMTGCLDEYCHQGKKIIESKTIDLNTKPSETVGKTNEANTQKHKTVYELVNKDKVIIEDWNSDDEDDVSEVQTVSPVKTNETQTVKTRVDKIDQTSKKQGIGFKKIKACFVCKSTDHLIKDCNFYDKQSQEPDENCG